MIYILSTLLLASGVSSYAVGIGGGAVPYNNGCDPCSNPAGAWGQWGPWSSCANNVYGVQSQTRTRSCSTNYCPNGEAEESRQCVQRDPTPAPEWNQWGGWGACSASCGGGTQTRTRTCNTQCGVCQCAGPSSEARSCNIESCCSWSGWSAWSGCSVTCGSGYRTRTRQCTCGSGCPGAASEQEACNSGYACPCNTCYQPPEPQPCNTCGPPINPPVNPCATCGPQQPYYNPYSNGRKRRELSQALLTNMGRNGTVSH